MHLCQIAEHPHAFLMNSKSFWQTVRISKVLSSKLRYKVYVGQSNNLRRRFNQDYRGVSGGHLRAFFDEALRNGCEIWRRCRALVSFSVTVPHETASPLSTRLSTTIGCTILSVALHSHLASRVQIYIYHRLRLGRPEVIVHHLEINICLSAHRSRLSLKSAASRHILLQLVLQQLGLPVASGGYHKGQTP